MEYVHKSSNDSLRTRYVIGLSVTVARIAGRRSGEPQPWKPRSRPARWKGSNSTLMAVSLQTPWVVGTDEYPYTSTNSYLSCNCFQLFQASRRFFANLGSVSPRCSQSDAVTNLDLGRHVSTRKCFALTRPSANHGLSRSSVCCDAILTRRTSLDGPQTVSSNHASVCLRCSKMNRTRSSAGTRCWIASR